MERWLRTDELEEATSALETTVESLRRAREDLYQWKWVILALHNSVQGFMVLALRGSHGLHTLRAEDAERWVRAHESGGPYPTDLKLDRFLNLYAKVKGDAMHMYVHSRTFVSVGTQDRSVRKLNALRNEFIHFVPQGWSLEVTGLPSICLDCLTTVGFLGWRSGNVLWSSEMNEARARQAMDRAIAEASRLKREYEQESEG